MIDNLIQLILKHSADQADPDVVNLELLEAAWPSLVGHEMAQRTRPRAWNDGTLHIDVSSHAWVQELSFHREELLSRIQKLFPWKLERLHLSVAQRFEALEFREDLEVIDSPLPKRMARRNKPLTEDDEAEVVEAMDHLDEETQAMLQRIRGHVKQRHDE